MKCPELYTTIQQNTKRLIIDDDIVKGEDTYLMEIQNFRDCYKEECAAWDKERQICKKIGGNTNEMH